MSKSNFERMLALAESQFDTRNDPNQLDVNENIISQLLEIHPSAVIEKDDGDGPVTWIILIPTKKSIMSDFLEGKISESRLFELTPKGDVYDAIYLCSAMTLEEYRNKGVTKQLCVDAVNSIRDTNPVTALFVWPFTKEGEVLAEKIAAATGIELYKKY